MNSRKLQRRMDELGLTQADLARLSGLSPGYIHLLVHGERGRRIGAEALYGLCKALKVSPEFFYPVGLHMKQAGQKK